MLLSAEVLGLAALPGGGARRGPLRPRNARVESRGVGVRQIETANYILGSALCGPWWPAALAPTSRASTNKNNRLEIFNTCRSARRTRRCFVNDE